jgi:hypothetical protein
MILVWTTAGPLIQIDIFDFSSRDTFRANIRLIQPYCIEGVAGQGLLRVGLLLGLHLPLRFKGQKMPFKSQGSILHFLPAMKR